MNPPDLLKPRLPHWLKMALVRIAEFGKRELDTHEKFPCLKHPGEGCMLHVEGWCLNCERSAGISAACDWIFEGMDLNNTEMLPSGTSVSNEQVKQ